MIQQSADIETIGIEERVVAREEQRRIVATILLHPEIRRIGDISVLAKLGSKTVVPISRLEPTFKKLDEGVHEPLETPFISRRPIEILCTRNGIEIQNKNSVQISVMGLPFSEGKSTFSIDELNSGVVLRIGNAVVLLIHMIDLAVRVQADLLGMIGHNREMHRLRAELLKVADLDKRVLIRGESGTGKELVAEAIWNHSSRSDKVFEKVNVTEIPSTIAERELFGAARHAGTGEPGHHGYFLRADKGTLFLDEIGDVDPAIQPKLLRAVETGEIQILGSNKKTSVDVRILAGTDVDLEAAVEDGSFKSSLLQRLSTYTLHIPPLRNRRDDIGRLFFHFLIKELQKLGEAHKLNQAYSKTAPWFPAELMEKLALFRWPGNVRQLKNVAERIAILNRGCSEFQRDARIENMLVDDVVKNAATLRLEKTHEDKTAPHLENLTDQDIIAALELNGFNISKTVQDLNVGRAKFYRLLKQRGIDIEYLREAWNVRRTLT